MSLIFSLGNCSYGKDLAMNLAGMLQNVLWSCGSVGISFSRRTPEKVYIPLAISLYLSLEERLEGIYAFSNFF